MWLTGYAYSKHNITSRTRRNRFYASGHLKKKKKKLGEGRKNRSEFGDSLRKLVGRAITKVARDGSRDKSARVILHVESGKENRRDEMNWELN